MKNNLELIPKTSPSKFLPGLALFMSRNIIADSQMNTRNIMNTLINFTRTGLPMLWKLTVPMNRAIVHNAACNDGTTFVCIASGVIFSNCVISKCKDSEKTPIIKISMVSHFTFGQLRNGAMEGNRQMVPSMIISIKKAIIGVCSSIEWWYE